MNTNTLFKQVSAYKLFYCRFKYFYIFYYSQKSMYEI